MADAFCRRRGGSSAALFGAPRLCSLAPPGKAAGALVEVVWWMTSWRCSCSCSFFSLSATNAPKLPPRGRLSRDTRRAIRRVKLTKKNTPKKTPTRGLCAGQAALLELCDFALERLELLGERVGARLLRRGAVSLKVGLALGASDDLGDLGVGVGDRASEALRERAPAHRPVVSTQFAVSFSRLGTTWCVSRSRCTMESS